MTDSPTAATVVAVVKPCEQYRYRVELPRALDRKVRADIRRRALQEVNDCFLGCTRTYQAMAWLGASNISFADSRHSPSDSKSEFLHMLICLKVIDLSYRHYREHPPAGETPPFAVEVEITLPTSARKGVIKLCEERGMELVRKDDIVVRALGRVRIGGEYRSSQHGGIPFALQPIKYVETLRSIVARRVAPLSWLRRPVHLLFRAWILLLWPIPIAARAVFSFYYRAAAARVLKRLDSPANVFIYFDLRLGRNRDIGAYMRWKYGTAFSPGTPNRYSCIPFTHIARPAHAYSFGAMVWAYQSLKRMETDPLSGCVVVNYLVPASRLLEVHFLRGDQRRKVRRKLVELERDAGDFFPQIIYKEFIASLDLNHGFPVEVSTCYDAFFGALAPGVVVQADAVAKTARHFTACARRLGSRVVYVADRICTSLRTSNQLIADGGDNPHFPDRCVVFDQVSKDEFVRQGMVADDIHSYDRNFAAETGAPSGPSESGKMFVVILLQAYEDNIGGMVRLGEEIARKHPELTVLYQEHPNFPVCRRVKSGLLKEMPGRLRFLEPREPVDFAKTLALVTGYSTAAVPGVLHGVPLIWLRRQIDNSIYGEAYLQRIGFAADKADEVNSILKRLLSRDPTTLEACVAATAEARAIFTPSSAQAARTLPEALAQAINDSFAEIAAAAPAAAQLPVRANSPGLQVFPV
jgi:hypothetical protein